MNRRKAKKEINHNVAIDEKDVVHPPGVEPGPIAWKAIILPLDQECLMEEFQFMHNIELIIGATKARIRRVLNFTSRS
jgi:hypothetical protein